MHVHTALLHSQLVRTRPPLSRSDCLPPSLGRRSRTLVADSPLRLSVTHASVHTGIHGPRHFADVERAFAYRAIASQRSTGDPDGRSQCITLMNSREKMDAVAKASVFLGNLVWSCTNGALFSETLYSGAHRAFGAYT